MEEVKLEKLRGDNYLNWAFRIKILLEARQLWNAIDPGVDVTVEENKKKDRSALSIICNAIEDNQLSYVRDVATAKEAWNSLKKAHTKIGLIHVIHLKRELYSSRLKTNESMEDYFNKVCTLSLKLDAAGFGLKDEELAHILLTGLPEDYDTLVVSLEASGPITVSKVKSLLINEENRRQKRQNDNLDTKVFTVSKFRNTSSNKSELKCHYCNKMGHLAQYCFKRKYDERMKNERYCKSARTLSFTNIFKSNQKDLWCLDSGATDHMVNNKNMLINMKSLDISMVKMANNQQVNVTGKGDIRLNIDNEEKFIILRDVLCVPELNENLISVSRLDNQGYKILFNNGKAEVFSTTGDKLLEATKKSNLYYVNQNDACQIKANRMSKSEEINLWHKRFGHLNFNSLQILHKNSLVNGLTFNNIDKPRCCSTCVLGKQTRTPFPDVATSRADDILSRIHSDICGPITPITKGGNMYFITFIDDFSRFTTVYLIKSKTEVLNCFIDFKKQAELSLNKKIKCFRSDNGKEFSNKNFDDYLRKYGIKREFSVAYSPQQNGVAERLNRTLVEMTRCLLEESGLDNSFWGEALATAVHIRNRCPTKALNNVVPATLWYGKKANISYFKTFGCECWSLIKNKRHRDKFVNKSYPCIFLGYSNNHKGYRLWNTKTERIEIARDVIFDESKFPLKIKTDTSHDFINKPPNFVTLKFYTEYDALLNEHFQATSTTEEKLDATLSGGSLDNFALTGSGENLQKGTTDLEVRTEEDNLDSSNTEFILRRSERLRTKNIGKTSKIFLSKDPENFKEALRSDDAVMWKEAMEKEMHSLRKNKTWTLVKRPKDRKIVGSKWVFRRKINKDGEPEQYKARLVAQGFSQVPGIDYGETFSPVVKWQSLRLLFALAAENNWIVHQMDVSTAYLNGTLQEEIYMEQPKGFREKDEEDYVCLLKKSLYGLKQSGRQWNRCLDSYLKEIGFTQSNADNCIYILNNKSKFYILAVYVDDIVIFGRSLKEINDIKKCLCNKFEMKDLGEINFLLGVKINYGKESITLNQENYVESILTKFDMQNCKPVCTPIEVGLKLSKENANKRDDDEEIDTNLYRQLIGSLIYLATTTRPDLAYSVTFLSQFNSNPKKEHWKAAKRILRYLQGTKSYTIKYEKSNSKLQGYCDSDWASDINDRRSYSGYIFTLANGPISWKSKKQPTVALSTAEAEYMALTEAAKENVWLLQIFKDLNMFCYVPDIPIVYCDNQSAGELAKNPVYHNRTKHIDIKFHFIREQVESKKIKIEYLSTENMPADVLTKALNGPKLKSIILFFKLI